MREAAQSVNDFLRMWDAEDADSAQMSFEIRLFKKSLGFLFRDIGCLKLQSGIVPFVLDLLSREQRVVSLGCRGALGQYIRTTGGKPISDDIINICLQRMVAWSDASNQHI